MLDDKKFRSILCLNSELPDQEFFQRNLPIIAADGAFLKLQKMNISPHITIGDFDSTDIAQLKGHNYLHVPEQNSSDFQKCLSYMKKESLLPAIVVGMHGGFLDHILQNINIFMDTDSVFYAPPIFGFTIKDKKTQRITTEKGQKISLIGVPSAVVETHGLKWDLNKSELTFPGKSACFNRANQGYVDITVHEGSVLVLQYLELIQDAGWSPHPVTSVTSSYL